MTDREVMQQALDALEHGGPAFRLQAITALRARLAEPEPVGTCGRRTQQGGETVSEKEHCTDCGASVDWEEELTRLRAERDALRAENERLLSMLYEARPWIDQDCRDLLARIDAARAALKEVK